MIAADRARERALLLHAVGPCREAHRVRYDAQRGECDRTDDDDE
jgi:hypothetical protein